jgi:hypothetical protein
MTGRPGAGNGAQAVATGKWRNVMFVKLMHISVFLALVCIGLGSVPDQASAITVEVAKKCNALIAKNFPPREPGNPAAGSAKGSGRVQRAYFSKCVENGGKMEDNGTN